MSVQCCSMDVDVYESVSQFYSISLQIDYEP
jgi:hypothetical protein